MSNGAQVAKKVENVKKYKIKSVINNQIVIITDPWWFPYPLHYVHFNLIINFVLNWFYFNNFILYYKKVT